MTTNQQYTPEPVTFSRVQTAYRLANAAEPELRSGLLDGAMVMEESLNAAAAQRDALAEALRGMLNSIEGPACCTTLDVNGNDVWPVINAAASVARAVLAKLQS